MTRLRRSFTAEFKLEPEPASLVLDQGYSVPEASRSLDVGETVLRRWVQQLQSERTGTTPISKALTPEQQKIQELEARINRLEREKDILKKLRLSVLTRLGAPWLVMCLRAEILAGSCAGGWTSTPKATVR